MDTPFGLRGNIIPADLFTGYERTVVDDGITILVKEDVIEVGYTAAADEDKARLLVKSYMDALSLKMRFRVHANLHQSWQLVEGDARAWCVAVEGAVKPSGQLRIATADIETSTAIAPANIYDSRDLANAVELVEKARRDEPLRLALQYYNDEIVETDRPLYGIYKVIEEIAKHLGKQGIKNPRKYLGELAGFDEQFVEDVMSTANVGIEGRHYSGSTGQRRLSNDKCRERARILIEAYAKSV
jgi:hypothetical protein